MQQSGGASSQPVSIVATQGYKASILGKILMYTLLFIVLFIFLFSGDSLWFCSWHTKLLCWIIAYRRYSCDDMTCIYQLYENKIMSIFIPVIVSIGIYFVDPVTFKVYSVEQVYTVYIWK